MRFNEAKKEDSLSKANKVLYFRTIYATIVEELKEFLDLYYADLLDDDNFTSKTFSDKGSFETMYIIQYKDNKIINTVHSPKSTSITKKNSLSSFADAYEKISEALRYIESRFEQIQEEYDNVSIYGEDELLPVNKFLSDLEITEGGFTYKLIIKI